MWGPGYEPYTIRNNDNIYNWIRGKWELITEPTIIGARCSPITAIGNYLSNHYSTDTYFINSAISSTGLHSCQPGGQLWNARGIGTLYQASLDLCSSAGLIPDVIFMFQGETDVLWGTSEEDYLMDLNLLANDYRLYFSNQRLPFIIAKLGLMSGVLLSPIRSAQEKFGTGDNKYNRRINGLETLPMSDEYHYTTPSLELIGQKFAIEYINEDGMATRTWNSTGSTDLNDGVNYTGSGALLETDDLVFDGTSVVNATATNNLIVASINITAAYSGAMSFAGYTAFYNTGDATFDGSGTLNFGNSITLNGNSATLHVGSGVGAVTSTACSIVMNGVTAMVLDIDKTCYFKTLTLGIGAVITNSGAGFLIVQGATTPFIMGNNSTLTNNAVIIFALTANALFYTIGSGCTIAGSSIIYFWLLSSLTTITFPAITILNTPISIFDGADYLGGWTIIATGAVNVGTGTFRIYCVGSGSEGVIDFNDQNVTCGDFYTGINQANEKCTVNFKSGSFSISSFNGNTYHAAGEFNANFQTSQWFCSGNWIFGDSHTIVPGTSLVTINNTSTITSNGKSFYDLILDAPGKIITLADNLSCHDITVTAGTILAGNYTVTCSGDALISGSLTFNRLIMTKPTTRTITVSAGTTLTLINLTASNLNGSSGALTQWRSGTPGTRFNLVIPSPITLTYQNPMDVNSSEVITANDGTTVDGGNNIKWSIPPVIITNPESQSVNESEQVVFFVAATGTDITYQWQRDEGDIEGETDTTYTIVETSMADNGASFRCVVTTAGGSINSDPAILTVISIPIISTHQILHLSISCAI
jgi:hypothetical protein